jgi:regulation of enolase protein 1 (concanavalin A-like superfamily)
MRTMQGACLLILGLTLPLVPALAQVPQSAAPDTGSSESNGWGLVIDPDKDCKFTPGPRSLVIDMPAAWHDLGGAHIFPTGKFNAPRVLREVDGNFVLTVKVTGDAKPHLPSTSVWSLPYLGGGILLWNDSDNFIRLERATVLRDGQINTYIAFEKREYGSGAQVDHETIKEGDCYLRLERKGSRILGAFSRDGVAWKQLKPIDTVLPSQLKAHAGAVIGIPSYIRTDNVWPNKLKVGLTAISTSSDPFSVKFEHFDLKTK